PASSTAARRSGATATPITRLGPTASICSCTRKRGSPARAAVRPSSASWSLSAVRTSAQAASNCSSRARQGAWDVSLRLLTGRAGRRRGRRGVWRSFRRRLRIGRRGRRGGGIRGEEGGRVVGDVIDDSRYIHRHWHTRLRVVLVKGYRSQAIGTSGLTI